MLLRTADVFFYLTIASKSDLLFPIITNIFRKLSNHWHLVSSVKMQPEFLLEESGSGQKRICFSIMALQNSAIRIKWPLFLIPPIRNSETLWTSVSILYLSSLLGKYLEKMTSVEAKKHNNLKQIHQ